MWLIYSLMLLDSIETLASWIAVISGTCLIVFMILFIAYKCGEGDPYPDFSENSGNIFKKGKNIALSIFIPFFMIALFVPNSKQAAIIYTAGSTIEYVQGNERIKELPDKAVQCLDKFISDYLNEDEDVENTEK